MAFDSNELIAQMRENVPHHYAVAIGNIRSAVGNKTASPFAKLRDVQTVLTALDVVNAEIFGRPADDPR